MKPYVFFGMKTVRLESHEYFLRCNNLLYSDLSCLSRNKVEQSVSLALCSLENVTYRLEVDDGRNHF